MQQKTSLLFREVMPFLSMFVGLIILTSIFDALLHYFDLIWVGRFLGIPGSLLILLSFIYSLRKRKVIQFSKPKTLLLVHKTLTLAGALMILVHAGIHVYTWLPWLALLAMLINVISGLTGQFLLARARRFLDAKKEAYAEQGLAPEVVEKKLFRDAITVELMKKWRTIHIPITLAFAVLAITHIVSILVFWEWK